MPGSSQGKLKFHEAPLSSLHGQVSFSQFDSLFAGILQDRDCGIPNPESVVVGSMEGGGNQCGSNELEGSQHSLGNDQDGHTPGASILPETSHIHSPQIPSLAEGILGPDLCRAVHGMHGSGGDAGASGAAGNGVGNVWWSFSWSPMPWWDIEGWNFPSPCSWMLQAWKSQSFLEGICLSGVSCLSFPGLEHFQGWRNW